MFEARTIISSTLITIRTTKIDAILKLRSPGIVSGSWNECTLKYPAEEESVVKEHSVAESWNRTRCAGQEYEQWSRHSI